MLETVSCQCQPQSWNASKSTEFQTPKPLSFRHSKPISDLFRIHCVPSRHDIADVVTPRLLKDVTGILSSNVLINLVDFTVAQLSDSLSPSPFRQILSLRVDLFDEDGNLTRKFDELDAKAIVEFCLIKKTDIVFDEVVPLLLKNADLWISSSLTVSPKNNDPSLVKLKESVDAPDVENNLQTTIKVFIDVVIVGEAIVKFKEIHTRDDFKLLLLHLMSKKAAIMGASVVSIRGLERRGKAEALGDYFHFNY